MPLPPLPLLPSCMRLVSEVRGSEALASADLEWTLSEERALPVKRVRVRDGVRVWVGLIKIWIGASLAYEKGAVRGGGRAGDTPGGEMTGGGGRSWEMVANGVT